MAKHNNIPELRFGEFENLWNKSVLENEATFSKGKGISKKDITEDGKYSCIRYGQLYTVYNEVIKTIYSKTNVDINSHVVSKKNDVIIPASGETQIDIATASCVLMDGVILGGDLNIIRSSSNGIFLSYYLNSAKKLEIARLSQGISVVHLYSSQLKGLKISLPSLPEQQKIADFLSTVDQKIQALERKKELLEKYKKGLMQKIFKQEIRFTPALSGAEGKDGSDYPEWEDKRLGEIGDTLNGLTGKTKADFGQGKLYIQYKQVFNSSKIDISECGLVDILLGENQNRFKFGDIFFTTSSETPNEIGTASVLLNHVDELYLNSFCFAFRVNSGILDPKYSRYLFRNSVFRKSLIPLAQGSTRYNISKSSFLKLIIMIPSIPEQNKIANFLSSIDDKIYSISSKIDGMKTWKKGLLQKMFV